MNGRAQRSRRRLLAFAAVMFAAATILYTVVWMGSSRFGGGLAESFEFARSADGKALEITAIPLGRFAARAGLRVGDRVTAIDDRPAVDVQNFYDVLILRSAGDRVRLTFERPGETQPQVAVLAFAPQNAPLARLTHLEEIAGRLMGFYPVLFLVVGLAVLFLRFDDPNAWLLALMFGGFIARAPLQEPVVAAALRGFAVSYQVAFFRLQGPLFLYFFFVFPARSALDRAAPWLKRLVLWASMAFAIPLAMACLIAGGSLPLWRLVLYFRSGPAAVFHWIATASYYGSFGLGLVSLISNAVWSASSETRRKARVIVWGTAFGLAPMFLLAVAPFFVRGRRLFFWFVAFEVLALSLIPLSFAYAVVKHRVMEIPVLLRRSARYLLVQRGFVVLIVLFAAAVTIVFATLSSRLFQSDAAALPTGLTAGVVFGMALAWGGARTIRGVTHRIDHAFFRDSYDARQILEVLSQQIRTISTREGLGRVLRQEIESALHPKSLAVFLAASDGDLVAQASDVPGRLSPQLPLLTEATRRGEAWEPSPQDFANQPLDALTALEPELLVPMFGREAQLLGLLALGMRLSEEPYSREDKRLLASVAAQAGVATESIQLAEQMARRIEAERSSLQEMEIAKQVQARLLPQRFPDLKTLECAGRCVQARQVGGDYYDFLSLSAERLGIVLADVAGKGISAALLMANLQANLRSQYADAAANLGSVLESVNRLFYGNTADGDYATMFFADYDDATGRIRYANCGHNPPLLLRRAGPVERLVATSTVIGLFENWTCETSETRLDPGDILVIYSDGVTEAASGTGEEFGEARLLQTIEALRDRSAFELMEETIAAVQRFGGAVQADDITLVVARRRIA